MPPESKNSGTRCTPPLPFGRKGLAITAISGVDLAHWDHRGKAADQTIAELLGGKFGESIPTYVTVWDEVTPEQTASHSAFKLHVESSQVVPAAVRCLSRNRRPQAAPRPPARRLLGRWHHAVAEDLQHGRRIRTPRLPHRGSEVWALHAIAAVDPQPLAESGRP